MPSGRLVVWIAAISLAVVVGVKKYEATRGK
jgi:hypothetical protein